MACWPEVTTATDQILGLLMNGFSESFHIILLIFSFSSDFFFPGLGVCGVCGTGIGIIGSQEYNEIIG